MLGLGMLGITYLLILSLILFRENVAAYLIHNLPSNFLTGRGILWVTVLQRANFDLLRGLGSGSFWNAGQASEMAQTVLSLKNPLWMKNLGSADGGYIDVVGALGFIGLALLLLSFVSNFRRIARVATLPASSMALAMISMFIFHNVTETTVYNSTNALWFLFLYFTYYLAFVEKSHTKEQVSLNTNPSMGRYRAAKALYE